MSLKKCTKCKESKPATEEFFYNQKVNTKRNGTQFKLTSWCKDCLKVKQVKYKQEHLEEHRERDLNHYYNSALRNKKIKERNKRYYRADKKRHAEKLARWQKANPERVKKHSRFRQMHKMHDVTKDEWENCKNYFYYRCAYCGLPTEEHYIKRKEKYIWSDFHKEHFSHEGANDITNLIPSCLWCNTSKYQSKYEDWYNENNENYNLDRHLKIVRWIHEDHKIYKDA